MIKAEIQAKIIGDIPKHYGCSFEYLRSAIMKSYRTNGYGSSDHFDSKHGYAIFYTDNNNFMNGIKQGGGRGFFARLNYVGMTTNIKISD